MATGTDAGMARLSRYHPVREVGRGTYGRAVLVTDTTNGEPRVLKYIDLNGLAADAATRALNEAAIIRRLNHPNIVRFYESFLAEGRLCIVTEYAANGTAMPAQSPAP